MCQSPPAGNAASAKPLRRCPWTPVAAAEANDLHTARPQTDSTCQMATSTGRQAAAGAARAEVTAGTALQVPRASRLRCDQPAGTGLPALAGGPGQPPRLPGRGTAAAPPGPAR